MGRPHYSLILQGVLLLAGESNALAQEYSRARVDPDGPYLYWRARRISFVLDAAGCPDADMGHTRAAVLRAFNSWEAQPCTDVFFVYEGEVEGLLPDHVYEPEDDEVDGYNLIVWLDDWPWSEERLAQTRILRNELTGEILDADIFLNGRDYYWTAADWVVIDIENVLAHEVGHLLGFEHTTDPEATMYDGYVEGETLKRNLEGTDIRGLCEVYPTDRPTPDVVEDDTEFATGCGCVTIPRPIASGPWLAVAVTLLLRRIRKEIAASP
jgi:hypothetical protein